MTKDQRELLDEVLRLSREIEALKSRVKELEALSANRVSLFVEWRKGFKSEEGKP